jgi:hypothetical protein
LLATVFSIVGNGYASLILCIPGSTANILDGVNLQNVSTEQTVAIPVLLQIE